MMAFRAPTNEQVKEALRRIPSPQLRRAFFEQLKNPLWLEPLAKEGVFDNPPEPETTPDGLVRDTYWPEINYLIQVAPNNPKLVVDILLNLSGSSNAWVRRAVFTIGASIPANEAVRLKPLLKSWLTSGFGWRSDPREMVDFAVNLLEGGQYKAGKWVANVLFRPGAASKGRKPELFMDDFWYEGGLPRVAAALDDDGLNLILPWLVEYERQRGHFTDKSDLSYFARESIRSHSEDDLRGHESVEQSLINAVRDLAVRAMRVSPIAANITLIRSDMILARKIALFAVGEVLSSGDLQPEVLAELLEIASELLADPQSRRESCRIEYAELARAVSVYDRSRLEPLGQYFAAGPYEGIESLRDHLRRDDDASPETLDERVEEWLNIWKHRWLSAIGNDALPTALRHVLTDLDARYGAIEDPLAPGNRVTSWIGPSSPVSQEDMASMTPAELVAHLESWHVTGERRGPTPSHEGQGRELTAVVTTNPRIVEGIDDLVSRLRPIYLRAVLRGWEAALKAGIELDWDQVAGLIRGVFEHPDESEFPPEGGTWDDDDNFRGAKEAAVSLLEDLVKKRDTSIVPAKSLATFAQLLLDQAEDETAWAAYDEYEHESDMDPLTLSINWQWPIRVRGLLNLLTYGKDVAWHEQAKTVFEAEIARPDRRGASRAILGEGIGKLLDSYPEWIESRAPELFGTADGLSRDQQISLTTAMAVHHYHNKLYDLLSPAMIAAIKAKEPLTSGWDHNSDPLQRIGEWVVSAVIFGHVTPKDPVVDFYFSLVDPKIRGDAIGRIAWSFMHANKVDDAIRDRLANFWDLRVEHVRTHPEDKHELSEFHWFVKSGKFDVGWWLPRLREALDLDPELATERYMIGKEIASAADIDPHGALAVAKSLLALRDESGLPSWELTRNAVPIVIARAMDAGDESLKREAIEFMNYLGEQGNVALEQQVKDVLSGSITQDDVDD